MLINTRRWIESSLTNLKSIRRNNSRISIITEITDRPGALLTILRSFQKYKVNLTQIESRPVLEYKTEWNDQKTGISILLNFEGNLKDNNVQLLIEEMKSESRNLLMLNNKEVSWFPMHISDIDTVIDRSLSDTLIIDHPGFNDIEYLERRNELSEMSRSYKFGEPIPTINYNEKEITTWGIVFSKLKDVHSKFACSEYLDIMSDLEKYCGYNKFQIPQAQVISDFLHKRTGFQLRPVTGLLSSRYFLNALAFRVFCSTQYIRHSSRPFYTPEPDICHEYIGHIPMFADKDFADFSQEIGLASLGASDEDIQKLSSCYWFSVEFGLIYDKNDNNKVKAYGAGLLSSAGEIEHACSNSTKAQYVPWDPKIASVTSYPITSFQPLYYIADSLTDVKDKMRLYCNNLNRPFHARYDSKTKTIWVDRAIKMVKLE